MDENDEDFEMLFNQTGLSDLPSRSEALFEQPFGSGDHPSTSSNSYCSLLNHVPPALLRISLGTKAKTELFWG